MVFLSNINISMQIWDFPGQIDFFDPAFDSELIFGNCGALVFVIDAQVCLLINLQNPSATHASFDQI